MIRNTGVCWAAGCEPVDRRPSEPDVELFASGYCNQGFASETFDSFDRSRQGVSRGDSIGPFPAEKNIVGTDAHHQRSDAGLRHKWNKKFRPRS